MTKPGIIQQERMSIFPLSEMPITLRVATIAIDGATLNLNNLFWCLPVSGINVDLLKGKSENANVKLPSALNDPGKILSMRYGQSGSEGSYRGIRRSWRIRFFPNAITIDIGTKARIASIKLSQTMKITGLRKKKDIWEAGQMLIDIIKETKSRLQEVYDSDDINSEQTKNFIEDFLPDLSLSGAEYVMKYFLKNKPEVYTGDPKLGEMKGAMLNYNFRLDHPINVAKFPELMVKDGFFSCKHSQMSNKPIRIVRRKSGENDDGVKFMVHSTGYVTLSGPDSSVMEPIYNFFLKRYLEIKDEVSTRMKVRIRIKQKANNVLTTVDPKKLQSRAEKSREFREKLAKGEVKLPEFDDVASEPQVSAVQDNKVEEIDMAIFDY